MAIPTDLFRVKTGIAVMRYDYALAEWFFVCWSTKNNYILDLPPGSHKFELWLVTGDLSGAVSVTMYAWCGIYALKARR